MNNFICFGRDYTQGSNRCRNCISRRKCSLIPQQITQNPIDTRIRVSQTDLKSLLDSLKQVKKLYNSAELVKLPIQIDFCISKVIEIGKLEVK